ncbi:MAG TPA: hypothetical protein VGK94_01985 [Candidatus Polarisedimenticolia bacterium]|jgi:hypothetical protein
MGAARSAGTTAFPTALKALFLALLAVQFALCAGSFSTDAIINDDYRQNLFWAPSLVSPGLFTHDLLADYSRGFNPPGLKFVYGLALGAGLSGPAFSKVLSIALFLIFLAGVGCLANRLGGRRFPSLPPLLLIFILLNNKYYFRACMGGLARNFAFPLQAWMAYALITRNAPLALFITLVSSLFHPPTFLLCLVSLLAWQLQHAARMLGKGRPMATALRRPVLTLLVGAAAAAPLVLSAVHMSDRFGPIVTRQEVATMAEFQLRGRWWREKPLGLPLSLLEEARVDHKMHRRGLRGLDWRTGMAIVLYGSFIYWVAYLFVHRRALFWRWSPLLLAALCAMFLFTLSDLFLAKLYFPNRFLRPLIPLLVTAIVCERIASGAPAGWTRPRRILWHAWAAVVIVGMTRFFSSDTDVGYPVNAASVLPVAQRVKALPADRLIAAYPKEDADNISIFGEHSVFIQREVSHALYRGYLEEVRRRTFLCLAGLFPVKGDEEVARLAREGVDYVLVNKGMLSRLAESGTVPEYDEPYRSWLLLRLSPARARLIERHWTVRMKPFVEYEDSRYMLVRISDFQAPALAAHTGTSPIIRQ